MLESILQFQPNRTIAEAGKDLIELVITYSNTKEVLKSLDVIFTEINKIEFDEESGAVTVHYSFRENNLISFAVIVIPLATFLPTFFDARHHRGQFYEVTQFADDPEMDVEYPTWIVQDRNHPDKSPHTVWHEDHFLHCSCLDYANQRRAFLENLEIWETIGRQPACKHIFAVADDQQEELEVERLIMASNI